MNLPPKGSASACRGRTKLPTNSCSRPFRHGATKESRTSYVDRSNAIAWCDSVAARCGDARAGAADCRRVFEQVRGTGAEARAATVTHAEAQAERAREADHGVAARDHRSCSAASGDDE